MKMLISCQEVLDMAFSNFDQTTQKVVKETKIIAAQEKYLRPVLGSIYTAMLEGKYPAFVDEYIKPALAYFIRHGMLPDLSVQIGNNGMQNHFTPHSNVASDKQREILRSQALDDANSLLAIAVRHIESNADMFPEYKPSGNIQRKVKFIGGIIL